ncbi:MAG: CopD family protein [Flavobacteriales bacterium]|jgi:putative copper export protein|nr:CopD family protein [Flavobacteriales bacterium]
MGYTILIVLHLLGATIWVGGHLVLLLTIVPGALATRDVERIRSFEQGYERIGIPALIIQVVTGLMLAHRFVQGVLDAFTFADRLHTLIAVKLLLLLATAAVGAHARLRIIPRLSAERLPGLAVHVALVTTLAMALLVCGALVRG